MPLANLTLYIWTENSGEKSGHSAGAENFQFAQWPSFSAFSKALYWAMALGSVGAAAARRLFSSSRRSSGRRGMTIADLKTDGSIPCASNQIVYQKFRSLSQTRHAFFLLHARVFQFVAKSLAYFFTFRRLLPFAASPLIRTR